MSAWEKLCAELSKAIWENPRSYVATRFERVKAEGDGLLIQIEGNLNVIRLQNKEIGELKEKAEKWDEALETLKQIQGGAFRAGKNTLYAVHIINELKKIEAIKSELLIWDNIQQRDRHAAPSILENIFGIILEGEIKTPNPIWNVWYVNPDDGKEYYMMVQAPDEEAAKQSFKETRWKGEVEPTRVTGGRR